MGLDRYITKDAAVNDLTRAFHTINRNKHHEDLGLGAKLQTLIRISNTLNQSISDEEKLGRFYDIRFRSFPYFDDGLKKWKYYYETADSFMNRLIDAQSEINVGDNEGQLVSDKMLVTYFRQQITSCNLGFSTVPDGYDRLIYDELIKLIADNRRNPTKHADLTRTVTGLSAKLKELKAQAIEQGWTNPSDKKKHDRRRNAESPVNQAANAAVGTASNHPPATSPPLTSADIVQALQAHLPQALQQIQSQHGNIVVPSAPSPAAAPFQHSPQYPIQRDPNSCYRCLEDHGGDFTLCKYHESKVGASPWKGVKGADGRPVCMGCGKSGHPMRQCPAPGRTNHMPLNTVGFHFSGLNGPRWTPGQTGNLSNTPPTNPSPSSTSSSSSHTGAIARSQLRPLSTDTSSMTGANGFTLLNDDDVSDND